MEKIKFVLNTAKSCITVKEGDRVLYTIQIVNAIHLYALQYVIRKVVAKEAGLDHELLRNVA